MCWHWKRLQITQNEGIHSKLNRMARMEKDQKLKGVFRWEPDETGKQAVTYDKQAIARMLD